MPHIQRREARRGEYRERPYREADLKLISEEVSELNLRRLLPVLSVVDALGLTQATSIPSRITYK